jgi:hypothetical protein
MRGHSYWTALCRLTIAGTALIALAACQESRDAGNPQEMAWAKAALERNPNLEIIATDSQRGVFTVRDRVTQQVHAVRLNELAAAPTAQFAAARGAPATSASSVPVDEDMSDPYAPPSAPEPEAEAQSEIAAVDSAEPDYKIERSGGQVRVTGPGLSIVSGSAAPPASARGEAGQRNVDPIVCEGRRTVHLDDQRIYVDGDAITVTGGCELYLTNSRIVASNTGLVVRDGVVHIANSYVEGGAASFDVGSAARVYLRGSTLQGLLRREEVAMIEDQGGNLGLPTL